MTVAITKIGNRFNLGFTLIELLVVLTIIGLLLSIATPRYFASIEKSKEVALKHDLSIMRESISHFFNDQGRYPSTLEELVETGYLKSIPADPITNSNSTWVLTSPPLESNQTGIFEITSGANSESSSGKPYSSF